jgi:5-methylcytosine-specific restriction endonuclease McrA
VANQWWRYRTGRYLTYDNDVPAPRKRQIPNRLRKEVFERDAYRCRQCEGWVDLAVDHIIPESRGGPTGLDNLQTLCRTCNSSKGAKV